MSSWKSESTRKEGPQEKNKKHSDLTAQEYKMSKNQENEHYRKRTQDNHREWGWTGKNVQTNWPGLTQCSKSIQTNWPGLTQCSESFHPSVRPSICSVAPSVPGMHGLLGWSWLLNNKKDSSDYGQDSLCYFLDCVYFMYFVNKVICLQGCLQGILLKKGPLYQARPSGGSAFPSSAI